MIKLVSTVGFIILNEENKILLVRRCENDKKEDVKDERIVLLKEGIEDDAEDLWVVPLGNLDDNDDPRYVIKKEVKKCFNCEVADCNYFNLYFYNISDNFIKKVSYFYGHVEGEIVIKNESMSVEWVSLNRKEIENLNLNPEQKTVLMEFLEFLQNKGLN